MARPFPSLRHPIIQAPLAGGPSTPALAAAVSAAGGLGFLAAGYKSAAELADEIARLRLLAGDRFGVNLFWLTDRPVDAAAIGRYVRELSAEAERVGSVVGEPRFEDDDIQRKLEVIVEERVRIASFTFGCPPPDVIDRLHRAGMAVWITVTTPDEAALAEIAGADALVVQSAEAGGHRASFVDADGPDFALLPLLGLVRRVSGLPMVASGGVADGAGVAAALAAGAVAAQMGTAFLRTPEAGTNTAHRVALTEGGRTAVTRAFTGRRARGIVNRFLLEHDAGAPAAYPHIHHATAPIRAAARRQGDAGALNLWAGEAYGLADEAPAGELVARWAAEARTALDAATRRLVDAAGLTETRHTGLHDARPSREGEATPASGARLRGARPDDHAVTRPTSSERTTTDSYCDLPIAEYGLLSDCSSASLLSRNGSIDWLCLPRFDSPAVFSRILDPAGGHWFIRPTGEFRARRRYLPGTLAIETTFTTEGGSVRMVDVMAARLGQRGHDLGLEAPHELLRCIEGSNGAVGLVMELAPRPEYGLVHPLFRATADGGRTFGGPNQLVVNAGVPVRVEDSTMRATFSVAAGETVAFSLRWAAVESQAPLPTPVSRVADHVEDTLEAWRSWESLHDIYEGPHRDLVRLSSRVLKGLSYRPTGAIVAAPTTSLPETVGGERNWDYRYAWIRDASLVLQALYIGTCPEEAGDFVSFMTSSAGGAAGAGSSLQIMYGIGGEHDLSERELPHLRGWRGSAPVRVGNGAWSQVQLDVYGELLDTLHRYREQLGALHPEIQRFVADLADTAARRWNERDAGMWEMRGEPRHHLSSKVLCWTALDRAVRLAPALGEHARSEPWARERDLIREAILTRGWSDARQAYAQSFDSDELDASALLMPLVGFLPATDPRMRSTIEAIARELTQDGLVLRYHNEEGLNADGLTGEEGTFVICSFWLVSCLAQAGELARAETLFDRLAGFANDLGLLAEEIDGATGELLGNFPQAFSHIGLITSAWEIDQATRS